MNHHRFFWISIIHFYHRISAAPERRRSSLYDLGLFCLLPSIQSSIRSIKKRCGTRVYTRPVMSMFTRPEGGKNSSREGDDETSPKTLCNSSWSDDPATSLYHGSVHLSQIWYSTDSSASNNNSFFLLQRLHSYPLIGSILNCSPFLLLTVMLLNIACSNWLQVLHLK